MNKKNYKNSFPKCLFARKQSDAPLLNVEGFLSVIIAESISKILIEKSGRYWDKFVDSLSSCEADRVCTEIHETGLDEAMSPLSALDFSDLHISNNIYSQMVQAATMTNYANKEYIFETIDNNSDNMNLPLISNLIDGTLSQEVLSSKDTMDIILLNQKIEKYCLKPNIGLSELRYAIIDVFQKGLGVNVTDDLKHDRQVYDEALEHKTATQIEQGSKGKYCRYTHMTWVQLNGLFGDSHYENPLDELIHNIVIVEIRRTRKYYQHLVIVAQDDQLVKKDVIETLNTIMSACRKTNNLFVQKLLTILYAELYESFKKLLEDDDCIVKDLKKFIYLWAGEYPDEEVVRRYEEMVNSQSTAHTNYANEQPDVPQDIVNPEHQPLREKSSIEQFKEAAEKIGFFNLERVKALKSKQSKLCECLFGRSEDYGERLCYVAAWLDYLGVEELFKRSKKISRHPVEDYIKWCEKYIMGMKEVTGTCFKRYRAKAKENIYRQKVEEEYLDFLDIAA